MSRAMVRTAATRTYQRVGSDFGFANIDRILIYGGIFGLGYLVYKIWSAAQTAKKAAEWAAGAAGDAAADAFEWFVPLDVGDMLQYRVKFPDGSMHAVGSRAVSSDGQFSVPTVLNQGGQNYYAVADIPALRGTYRLAVDKSIASGDNKVAVKLA